MPFRIFFMKNSKNLLAKPWKTLSAMWKHAVPGNYWNRDLVDSKTVVLAKGNYHLLAISNGNLVGINNTGALRRGGSGLFLNNYRQRMISLGGSVLKCCIQLCRSVSALCNYFDMRLNNTIIHAWFMCILYNDCCACVEPVTR